MSGIDISPPRFERILHTLCCSRSSEVVIVVVENVDGKTEDDDDKFKLSNSLIKIPAQSGFIEQNCLHTSKSYPNSVLKESIMKLLFSPL